MSSVFLKAANAALAICLSGAAFTTTVATTMAAPQLDSITQQPFGKTSKDGRPVELYTLRNTNGCEATITNYGGIVTSLKVPDKNGCLGDVVLGYDTLAGYESDPTTYFGALIGRVANRIARGQFSLDDKHYQLPINNSPNSLHGGPRGFDKRVWDAMPLETAKGPALRLHYASKDGEEGYPGNLSVTATYTLTNRNELRLDFTATTDKDTVVNLTQHCYFNLAGAGHGDILDHIVKINADQFAPINKTLIPTGELRSVKDTPFDFTKPTAIGARINQPDEQLQFAKGYDHNYVLRRAASPFARMTYAAQVYEPTSGRVLEVRTTQPGLQFYTGNFLTGQTGKGGAAYKFRSGFCMEAQHFPDSPNHPNFPSIVLKPGETLKETIVYRFSVCK